MIVLLNEIEQTPEFAALEPEKQDLVRSRYREKYGEKPELWVDIVQTPEFSEMQQEDQFKLARRFDEKYGGRLASSYVYTSAGEEIGDRGAFGDVLSNLARGVSDVGQMVGGSLQELDLNFDRKGGALSRAGQRLEEFSEQLPEKYSIFRPDIAEVRGEDSKLRSQVMEGVRAIPLSVSPLITGIIGGSVAGIPGAVGGFGVGITPFFLGTYHEARERYQEVEGISEEEKNKAAWKSAIIEGGGELVSDAVVGLIGWTAGPGAVAGKVVTKNAVKSTLKKVLQLTPTQMAKNFGKIYAAELSTETMQNKLQTDIEAQMGLQDKVSFSEALIETAIPTLVVTGAFSLVAGGMGLQQKRKLIQDLNAIDVRTRVGAANSVYKKLVKEDPDIAEGWKTHVLQKINNQEPVNIKEEFLSQTERPTPGDILKSSRENYLAAFNQSVDWTDEGGMILPDGKELPASELPELLQGEIDDVIQPTPDSVGETTDQETGGVGLQDGQPDVQEVSPEEDTGEKVAPTAPKIIGPSENKYFDRVEGSELMDIAQLTARGETSPQKLQRAKTRMAESLEGKGDRRPPIDVVKLPDGRLRVMDGNTTLQALQDLGEKNAEVVVHKKPVQSRKYVVDTASLVEYAKEALPSAIAHTNELAEKTGGTAKFRTNKETGEIEVKKADSLERKIQEEYKGDPAKVRDAIGSTIYYDTTDEMLKAWDQIKEDPNIFSWKSRIDEPIPSGYVDININYRLPNGHIAELQLNTSEMMKAKKRMHKLYKAETDIYDLEEKTGEPLTDAEADLADLLTEYQKERYGIAAELSAMPKGKRDQSEASSKARSLDTGDLYNQTLSRLSEDMGSTVPSERTQKILDRALRTKGEPSLSKNSKGPAKDSKVKPATKPPPVEKKTTEEKPSPPTNTIAIRRAQVNKTAEPDAATTYDTRMPGAVKMLLASPNEIRRVKGETRQLIDKVLAGEYVSGAQPGAGYLKSKESAEKHLVKVRRSLLQQDKKWVADKPKNSPSRAITAYIKAVEIENYLRSQEGTTEVLYSAQPTGLVEGYTNSELEQIEVKVRVLLPNNRKGTITMDAKKAIQEVNAEIELYEQIRRCMG